MEAFHVLLLQYTTVSEIKSQFFYMMSHLLQNANSYAAEQQDDS